MIKQIAVFLLLVLVGLGCASKDKGTSNPPPGSSSSLTASASLPPDQKPASSDTAKLIVTPEKTLTGKVATYNDTGRFVVLEFPVGNLPAVDQRMFVYRRGLKVGEVRINNWQRDRYIVADLTVGEAQSGDEVRDK